jgi:hypothetical protein
MTQPARYLEQELNDKPPLGDELGSSFSWTDIFGGWENGKVFEVPNPEFIDYQEMLDTDGKASSIEHLLAYPIIAAPWEIDPAKDDNGEAEAMYEALTALPHQGGPRTTVEQLVSQMTMAFTHKKTYFEKVFKVNDHDMVVYDKIAWRPIDTVEPAYDAKTSDMCGFRQAPVTWEPEPRVDHLNKEGYVYIPPERAFIYTHGTWRDPLHGISSMKVPYWCWVTKRKLRWLWYQFLDQTMLPKTIVQNPDEIKARTDASKVSTLRSKGVLGLSDQTKVTAYESSGHGAAGYIEAIRYLESEMSNSILAGFMDLTSQAAEGKGSYALAESQGKLFLRTRRMVAKDMARQITNMVIGDLVRYNFGLKASCPRFAFGPLSEQNEMAVLDMFKSIATTGAKVSPEFYDELQIRVATLLELDPGKVKEDMDNAMAETPGELENMAQQADVATQMVANAQATGQIPVQPGSPPPPPKASTKAGRKVASRSKSDYGKESVVNGG